MGKGILKEHTFSVDDFNQPKVVEGRKAIGVLIIRLILLEPGTNQNRPDMGLGIVSRFRYIQNSDLPKLTQELKTQISTYLTPYQNTSVNITMNEDLQLVFDIHVDDYSYKYVTEKQESNRITLVELKEQQ